MSKKFFVLVMMICLTGGLLLAGGKKEQTPVPAEPVPAPAPVPETVQSQPEKTVTAPVSGEAVEMTVNMAVFKGPSGFGYVRILEEGDNFVDGITISTQVLPSPAEAVARLTSGEIDAAAMPVNTAAALFNKGVDVQLAAVTGEGMLYLMSSAQGAGPNLKGYAGKTIYVPGTGSTPDYVSRYVFEKSGLVPGKDVVFDYSINSPVQLAQMLIAGKVESAVLPEPFASMAAAKNAKVKRTVDLQKDWSFLSGQGNYPMTVLLVRRDFAQKNPLAVRVVQMGVEDSITWVNANPKEASVLIEKYEILTAALAEPAIPNCNLVYRPAAEARADIESYLSVLASFDSASIGGSLPDEAFYLEK